MKKESKKKLIITLISIFVFILAVLLIIFVAYSTIEDNKEDADINTNNINNVNNNLDEEQMKIDCINLGCPESRQSIYAGSKNSDKYYECNCGYAKNILPENLVCFASDEDAIADAREKVEC